MGPETCIPKEVPGDGNASVAGTFSEPLLARRAV